MRRDMPEVTETELAILDALWECGPSSIRDIVATLYGKHTTSLHATVNSLLERLEKKGYVEPDKSGFAYCFSAKVSREAYVGQQIMLLANSHFHGAVGPMLLSLVDRVKLS